MFVGKRGLYKKGRMKVYGQKFWRSTKKRKNPYSINAIGSDGSSVDYEAINKRTGWKKSFTLFSANGKKFWN